MEQIKYVALGDNFLVDKAKKINETLEKINAPYYQVCKKVRGKANKDAYAISWRKKNMSCDSEYPNVTATSEKVIDRYLQKVYNVSLNSLIKTPIASIKKANDYVLKINAEKEKKEQLKRKKIEEREAKRLAKSTTKGKKENKTIEKETEKEIQKIVSKTGNNQEVKIENNDGKVAIFYTLTSNGKRRNHAKLNFANNRVTYLSSNTPQYVKDHIKQYKLTTSTATNTSTPAKEDRARSIKSDKQDYLNYKEWRKEEREKYKDAIENMYSSIKNDLPKEIQNVIELLPVKNGYKIEFNTNDSNIIRINIDIDRSIKSGKNKDVDITFNYETQKEYIPQTYLDGTDLFEKGKVYNDAIRDIVYNIKQFSKITPAKEEIKVFPKVALKDRQQLIKATKELVKVWFLQKRTDLYNKINFVERYWENSKILRLDINNDSYELEFRERYDDDDRKTYFSIVAHGKFFVRFKKNALMSDIGEELKEFIDNWLDENINKIQSKEEKPKEEIKVVEKMIEEEQVLIPKEPEIKVDDAEAEKFDKGLDELTKLLQQAMQ